MWPDRRRGAERFTLFCGPFAQLRKVYDLEDVVPEFAVGPLLASRHFFFLCDVVLCITQFDPQNLQGSADDLFAQDITIHGRESQIN